MEREEVIEIIGAREQNLKNIHLKLPSKKLIVITGISGSGKSSLAFDTIYAEGQRRYMESFSAYARNFIGDLERPDVDKIEGLNPVISIEQKTTSRNPRSTVGTVTEIYDFLRLLYARAGDAYSYHSGKKMTKQSEDQIVDMVLSNFQEQILLLLAPVVKGRKGHYRELFVQIRKKGYTRVRIDGKIIELTSKMQLDRYQTHDIEIVVDRIKVLEKDKRRIRNSIHTTLNLGEGVMMISTQEGNISYYSKNLMDPETGLSYNDPAPNTFSFNSPYGACTECNGLGSIEKISIDSVIPNRALSIFEGGMTPIGTYRDIWIFKKIESLLKKWKLSLTTPIEKFPEQLLTLLLYGDDMKVSVPSTKYPGTTWNTQFEGIINFLQKQKETGSEKMQSWLKEYTDREICHVCEGMRLKKEALSYRIDNKNIGELSSLDISSLYHWLSNLEDRLLGRQRVIAEAILKELRKRTRFLLDVGLHYLSLNRSLNTLSGGESQRIRLATQIGTQLINVLYVLDEPSIGLHQRDNIKLINSLKELRDLGNTVIVVEHDKEIMLAADYIVDIGPGAGQYGGKIVAQGSPKEFLKKGELTASYLNGKEKIEVPEIRRKPDGKWVELIGASGHNLKNVNFKMPVGCLNMITGVSGSGKSSLIHGTLYPLFRQKLYKSRIKSLPFKKFIGYNHFDKIVEIDQLPIGRTPRSNPATYTGLFTEIRNLFTQLPEAKIRGYKPGRFSFNVKGGRCETCHGGGKRLIEMDYLPNIYVHCEVCKGKRYNRETLEIRFKGKSISDVLDMTVSQAVVYFENQPRIVSKIKTLDQLGLGYIALGQHATTLSGGEAQRIKLASEFAKRETGKTIYILDEPTTGLHFQDIKHLLVILQKLVDKGNTVLIIEHNMDVIKIADYVVDLGLDGGDAGGNIIAEGTPEEIIQVKDSFTAKYLSTELAT